MSNVTFEPNPYQQKFIKLLGDSPVIMRSGEPSAEMIHLAKYLRGEYKRNYRTDFIIFDELSD